MSIRSPHDLIDAAKNTRKSGPYIARATGYAFGIPTVAILHGPLKLPHTTSWVRRPHNETTMATVFAERLAPLRARMEAQRIAIRPVSRVWFELSDKAAFEQCIDLCLKWMETRSRVKFPVAAWRGQTFDVTDVLGANPSKAVRIEASDGAIWAARLDWPDPLQPRTWVSEFFVEHRQGHLSRFGAQLTCVLRGDCPPYDVSRPTVVRHVLERLSAEADGWALADTATKVDPSEIGSLEELLYAQSRRLPVVAISEADDGSCRIAPDMLARQIAGAAHIVHLTTEASWRLTHALGKRMSVFNGAVRLYLPGLSDETENPYQHPLWFLQDGAGQDLIQSIAARVLPFAFLRTHATEEFPRFAVLRDFSARLALAQRPSSTEIDRMRSEFNVLKSEFDEAAEEREAWQSLAQEEQAKRLAAEAEIERLKSENTRLDSKAAVLQHRLENRPDILPAEDKADRTLNSYHDLEDWAEEVLGEHIYIHQAALKDCKKNGHDNMLSRLSSALLVIRDYVVPFRTHGGLERRNLAREKLGELGMEDTPCFADRDEAKRTTGYSVQYEGETWALFDHIKYGNGYDNANQIRIYYFWDPSNRRFVVGKMPSHLRNNLTS